MHGIVQIQSMYSIFVSCALNHRYILIYCSSQRVSVCTVEYAINLVSHLSISLSLHLRSHSLRALLVCLDLHVNVNVSRDCCARCVSNAWRRRRRRLRARLDAPRAARAGARAARRSRRRWRGVRLQRPVRRPAARLAAARRPLAPLRASPRAFCVRLRWLLQLLHFLHCSRVCATCPLDAELRVRRRCRSRHPRHRHSHTTSAATAASDLSARWNYWRQWRWRRRCRGERRARAAHRRAAVRQVAARRVARARRVECQRTPLRGARASRAPRATAHMHEFVDDRRAGGRRPARARRTRLLACSRRVPARVAVARLCLSSNRLHNAFERSDARLCATSGAPVPPVLLRGRPARVLSWQPATARAYLPRRPLDPRVARALLYFLFRFLRSCSERKLLNNWNKWTRLIGGAWIKYLPRQKLITN